MGNKPDAAATLRRAEPLLLRIADGAEALGLEPHELLHAGPPLADPTRPPEVLRSAAVMTALHEGWAADEPTAEAMLASGALRLSPAQDRGCVTPLAAVVSAGTPLFVVADSGSHCTPIWAPVSPVRGPDTRMGHRDPALLQRLADRDSRVAPALAQWLAARGPLPLWPLAAKALAEGDDLHGRTHAGTAALLQAAVGALPAALHDDLAATPLFFLTIWMAACAAMLRSLEGADQPGWVSRGGGNGERFGIALAGEPGRWQVVDATPPRGWRQPSAPADAAVCSAIGDSAVIDLLGLGGQRLALAPEPLSVLAPHLPADHVDIAAQLLCVPHPALPDRWPLGLDSARVQATGCTPLVSLAMIAADGRSGWLGRGVYRVPVAVFGPGA